MANAEGKNKPIEADIAALVDRFEQFDDTILQRADFIARPRRIAPKFRRIIAEPCAQGENIIRCAEQACGPIIFNLLIAEPFHIKRLTRHKMLEPFARLRLACQTARAAQHDIRVAVFAQIAGCRRAAGRTFIWKGERLRSAWARLGHHAHNLRYHIASALYDHRVANTHILAGNLIGVVQGRIGNAHAANRDLLQFGNRRQCAGAPDLNVDILQYGGRLLRRKLMRDGPARRARHKPQPVLIVERVDLIDHAVNVIPQQRSAGLDILPVCQ